MGLLSADTDALDTHVRHEVSMALGIKQGIKALGMVRGFERALSMELGNRITTSIVHRHKRNMSLGCGALCRRWAWCWATSSSSSRSPWPPAAWAHTAATSAVRFASLLAPLLFRAEYRRVKPGPCGQGLYMTFQHLHMTKVLLCSGQPPPPAVH